MGAGLGSVLTPDVTEAWQGDHVDMVLRRPSVTKLRGQRDEAGLAAALGNQGPTREAAANPLKGVAGPGNIPLIPATRTTRTSER